MTKPSKKNTSPLIFLIAGEASGDQLGAALMIALKAQDPKIRFVGIGGEAMTSQGLRSLFPMKELSHMGIFSILRNLRSLSKRLQETVQAIQDKKPDIVVTIDAPEFNFRVLKKLQNLSERPRLFHYVAPTVWAWRPGRAKKVASLMDHLLCLYPFEPPYFEREGLAATFVGHPLGMKVFPQKKRDPNLLCLLPGSRTAEITTLLPIFKETVERVHKEISEVKVILPTLPHFKNMLEDETKTWPCKVQVVAGDQARDEAFAKAFVGLAASGTVALQLSAAHLPFVVAYKFGSFSAMIARRLINTPWACMVNILLAFKRLGANLILTPQIKEKIPTPWIPEYIQENCRADFLAPALLKLMKEESLRTAQVKAMEEAMDLLKARPDKAAKVVLGKL